MIERARLIEAVHVDRPLHGRAFAADCEAAVAISGNGGDAAVDFGRVGRIDRNLGRAGGFTLCECRIIEKWKTHGALDLEHPVAGEEYAGGMCIDAPDCFGRALIGRGTAKKGEHLVLTIGGVTHAAGPCWRRFGFS